MDRNEMIERIRNLESLGPPLDRKTALLEANGMLDELAESGDGAYHSYMVALGAVRDLRTLKSHLEHARRSGSLPLAWKCVKRAERERLRRQASEGSGGRGHGAPS